MTERRAMLRGGRGRSAGFSLQEVMVTMVIVGILASFALPSYMNSLRKAKRTDAFAALAAVADAQEIAYGNQAAPRSYTDNIADLGLDSKSPEGYYDLTLSACTDGTLADCYEVRATARSDGAQWHDAPCRWLSIDSRGRQSSGPDADACWTN